ncbi:MAG: acylneuraminate cytidylyltransferase family protein [Parcubacteria group bacterium]|nr:acylneuraminate cytidylyltransferase family protein [Parcubacteria group bacterium]
MSQSNIVAIIPARGGSKGLSKKNIQLITGHPLIAFAIEAARQSSLIQRVVVATDDEGIAQAGRDYGGEVPELLPDELTQDYTRLEDTFAYMTKRLLKEDSTITHICFVDPTRPIRPPGFLDEALQCMLDGGYDSVISGVKEHKSIWRQRDDQLERLDSGFTTRQLKKDKLFVCFSGMITCSRAALMAQGRRLGDKVKIFEFDDLNMTVDIHTKDELRLAELIIQEWGPERYIVPSRPSGSYGKADSI